MFEQLLYLIPLLLIVVCVYLVASPSSPFAKKVPIEFPYEQRDRLMTEAEGSFYHVLELALPEGKYRLFGKVRVEDLISVKSGLDRSAWQSFRNRIKSRHIDIVVVDRKTFKLIWAIELDDKSHNSLKRKERDTFLDNAFKAAGLPLMHFKAKRSYTTSDIQVALSIDNVFQPNNEPINSDTLDTEVREGSIGASVDQTLAESGCPRCYAPMVKKRVRSGKYAGTEVLACTRYPKCRKLLPISDATLQ